MTEATAARPAVGAGETTTQVFRVTIDAPIQEVWQRITQRGEPLPHFFGSVMHCEPMKPGSPIRMRTPNGKYTAVVGEIVACEPPYRFAHTFRFTQLDDPECTVIYELKEVTDGTEFTLTCENVPVGTKTEGYMKQGGDFITKTLKSMVERGRPPLSSSMILLISKLMTPFTPKKCLTSNWT